MTEKVAHKPIKPQVKYNASKTTFYFGLNLIFRTTNQPIWQINYVIKKHRNYFIQRSKRRLTDNLKGVKLGVF